MVIPDFQSLMLPLLQMLNDGQEHSLRDAIARLEERFGLTEEERRALLPSGQQTVLHNRVGWARTYMAKAGLLECPRRGWMRITERGFKVLEQHPPRVDVRLLDQFEEFQAFRALRRETESTDETGPGSEQTPEDLLVQAYENLRQNLAAELLDQVKNASPTFFERLVLELLVRMGYGGSYREAAQAVGRSGDEGVDGIINEDRLGLDVVYIQAKRWNGPVSRPEVQKFAGALQGHHARKGVFITTSTFTKDAVEYAAKIDSKIVLIGGQRLVDLMIDQNLGVSTSVTYEVKKVDYDFFAEE